MSAAACRTSERRLKQTGRIRQTHGGYTFMKVVILGLAIAASLGACSRSNGSPASVAEEFVRKLANSDCAGIQDYLSDASKRTLGTMMDQQCAASKASNKGETLKSVTVTNLQETGDRATLTLTGESSSGAKDSTPMTLVREGGRWKIEFMNGAASSGAPAPAAVAPAAPTAAPGTTTTTNTVTTTEEEGDEADTDEKQ